MVRLALSFLGAPRLERDGVVVQVDTRKATALVAYLAVTHQEHSRETLAALLWPEYDQQHARGALRRTLSVLRGALGEEALIVTPERLCLAWDAEPWVDVDQFARVVEACVPAAGRTPGRGLESSAASPANCLADLAAAVELCRGDFLAGFTLRDSPEFDDWQFMQGESLRRDLGHLLERLVRACADQGQFEAAITYARRWLALDPLHEPVHRALMQLYAAAGQRSAAVRQYQECVRILQQELGVAPLEETTLLFQEIKGLRAGGVDVLHRATGAVPMVPQAIHPEPQSPVALAIRPSPGTSLQLIGRDAEWTRLLAAYGDAAFGGQLVVLEGEAGIGKTRLAEELAAHVAPRGAPAILLRCYQGEAGLAYAPFVAALRVIAKEMAAASESTALARRLATLPPEAWVEASRLLPAIRASGGQRSEGALPPLDGPGAQVRFFEGVTQVLLAACAPMASTDAGTAPSPGILVLDDVQWMDAASLDLLAYATRRLPGHALCLIVTWRSDEVLPAHPLRRLLAEGRRFGYAAHVSLNRLAPEALVELVAGLDLECSTSGTVPNRGVASEVLARERQEALAARLYRETEGLPFFIVEYLAALHDGRLKGTGVDWATPGGVYDLIEARLGSISGAGRQLLGAAAVLGRSFDFETLREVSGRSEEEAVAGLEELLTHGLVREVPSAASGPAYDFVHQKLCEVAYGETSLARRRLLHRRVAEILAGRLPASTAPSAPGHPVPASGFRTRPAGSMASLVAQHYELAGQASEAGRYYALAGAYARGLYANVEALGHFRTALALGHPDVVGLHEAIGDLQTLLGDYGAGLASYSTALALASADPVALPQPGAVATLTQVHLEHKLGMLHLRRGEWELAAGHLEDALGALHGQGENGSARLRSHLYADLSLAAHRQGHHAEAQALAQQAYDVASEAGDLHALAQAENAMGMLARGQGDAAAACGHLEASLALAETLNDPALRAAVLNNLALACAATGDQGRALTLTESALALVQTLGDRHREAALHNNLADLLHARGDHQAAMTHLKQAVTIFADIRTEAENMQPEIWKLSEW